MTSFYGSATIQRVTQPVILLRLFSSRHSTEQELLKVFSADISVALSSGYRLRLVIARDRVRIPVKINLIQLMYCVVKFICSRKFRVK